MLILNKSNIFNLSGNFETETDFTISNINDDDLGVFAKGTTTEGVADDVTIIFNSTNLSVIALLNINSHENILNVYNRNTDGTNGDVVIENMSLETTSQLKATFEFEALEDVNIEIVLKTNKAYVKVGEISIGHFSQFGRVLLPIGETPIFLENYVELDNGAKHYFYDESEESTRYSYNFKNLFLTRAGKLAFQSFINRYKKRNMLVKLSSFPEHIKFGKIENYNFNIENINECTITFEEVI